MIKGLLFVAHGSRNFSANASIIELVSCVMKMQTKYEYIEVAFLEFASPTIQEGLIRLLAHHVETIDVFPYFLASGNHCQFDIPNAIQEFEKQTDIPIRTLPVFGEMSLLPEILSQLLSA